MTELKNVAQNNGKLQQILATVIASLLLLSCGIGWGWPSPVVPQLQSDHPPVGDGPMNDDQVTWIGSLLPIGALMAVPFCGHLAEYFGRKRLALFTAVPHIVSWLLIIFGPNHLCIYLARWAMGLANGMTFFIIPLYVSEIVVDEIRGFLSSFLVFIVNFGILFAYIAGAFLPYRPFACLGLIASLSFVVTFAFIPETPVYLVRRNRLEEARKSLMFHRGNNKVVVEQALAKLEAQVKSFDTTSKTTKFTDLFRDRATRNGIFLSFGLLAGKQLSGIFAVNSYAETIFLHAGSSLSAQTASIITGAIQAIGSYASTLLMDRAGRRLPALSSCVGMTISHSLVGLYFYLQQNGHNVSSIDWLPVVALSTYIGSFVLGIGPVAIVFVSEVFRIDVSSSATNLCFAFYWALSIASVQGFNLSTKFLGDAGCFFVLAVFCVAAFVFTYFLVPETKGRDRQDIVGELARMGSRKCDDVDCPNINKTAVV